jgi:hypothetical protein
MPSSSKSLNKNKRALSAMLLLSLAWAGEARADNKPVNEMFGAMPSRSTSIIKRSLPSSNIAPPPVQPANPVTAPGALSMMSEDKPETRFFETFDSACFNGFPRPEERVILTRPFNNDSDRVQQWTETARNVSSRYRKTAMALRNLPVPQGRVDLANYKELKADWFDSAANVYEMLIKPKAPARTIEELQEQLQRVDREADSVQRNKESLLVMERSLRKLYRVHENRYTDALQNFVMGVPKQK